MNSMWSRMRAGDDAATRAPKTADGDDGSTMAWHIVEAARPRHATLGVVRVDSSRNTFMDDFGNIIVLIYNSYRPRCKTV